SVTAAAGFTQRFVAMLNGFIRKAENQKRPAQNHVAIDDRRDLRRKYLRLDERGIVDRQRGLHLLPSRREFSHPEQHRAERPLAQHEVADIITLVSECDFLLSEFAGAAPLAARIVADEHAAKRIIEHLVVAA